MILVVLLLIGLLFVTPGLATQEVLVQRLNYGILFEPTGHFKPINDYWVHTVALDLPVFPTKQDLPKPCTKNGNVRPQTCKMFESAFQQSLFIRNDSEQKCYILIQKIREMIPQSKLTLSDSRSKRALLPFIGQLSKSIFGTATIKDVQFLAYHVAHTMAKTKKLGNAFKVQAEKLNSFMSIVDSRISGAVAEIQNNHRVISEMGNAVWVMENGLALSTRLSGQMARQVQKATDLTSMLNALLNDIGDLIKGKISPTLIAPTLMSQILSDVQRHLRMKYPNFHVSHAHTSHYYKRPLFLAARQGDSIIISLKIPITAFRTSFNAYHALSVPVPINSSTAHATQILDMPDIFAISHDGQYYTTMSNAQWENCHGKIDKYCPMDIAIYPRTRVTCALTIFLQQKELIPDFCNFRFVKNAVKSSIFQLTTNQIVISNTSHLTVNCPSSEKNITGCNYCVMTVPCGCTIQTESFYLPAMIHTCQNSSKTYTKLHPVNLALLQYFYEPKTHASILGNSLFDNTFDPQLPHIKISNKSYNKFVATDRNEHLNLKTIAEGIKKNEEIYENSADALFDFIPQNPQIWYMGTIIMGGTSFVSFVCIGIALYITCKKVKVLSLVVLTLQKAQEAKALPYQTIPPHFQSTSPSNRSTLATPTDVYSEMHVSTSAVVYAILAMLGLLICIKLFNWLNSRNSATSLCLEITNGKHCQEVTIQNLPLCPHYWNFGKNQTIKNIEVQGSFKPKLKIDWVDPFLVNSMTNQKLTVETEKYLTWWTAYALKMILKTPFCTFVILRHHGQGHLLEMKGQIEVNELHDDKFPTEKIYPTLSA